MNTKDIIIFITTAILVLSVFVSFVYTEKPSIQEKQFMIRSTDTTSPNKNILVADDDGNLDVTPIDDLPFNIKTNGNLSVNGGKLVVSTPQNGYVALNTGDSRPGYIQYFLPDGKRAGFIGWKDDSSNQLLMNVENGYTGFKTNGNFSINEGKSLCIGNTCITEDDLKKLKNNTFPTLNVDGELAIRYPKSTNYRTLFNQVDFATLKMTSTYDGNANMAFVMGGAPYIDIKGNRVLNTTNSFRVNNIWADNGGYLHRITGAQQKNPVDISF